MNNVLHFQIDMLVNRNGNALWRPAPILSDEELFDEYRAICEEMRLRDNSPVESTH